MSGLSSGHTSKMIFPFAQLVAHMSCYLTLEPGDLITTGTPPGVGVGVGVRPNPVFLKPGDTMQLWVEKLGEQKQTVCACDAARIDA